MTTVCRCSVPLWRICTGNGVFGLTRGVHTDCREPVGSRRFGRFKLHQLVFRIKFVSCLIASASQKSCGLLLGMVDCASMCTGELPATLPACALRSFSGF